MNMSHYRVAVTLSVSSWLITLTWVLPVWYGLLDIVQDQRQTHWLRSWPSSSLWWQGFSNLWHTSVSTFQTGSSSLWMQGRICILPLLTSLHRQPFRCQLSPWPAGYDQFSHFVGKWISRKCCCSYWKVLWQRCCWKPGIPASSQRVCLAYCLAKHTWQYAKHGVEIFIYVEQGLHSWQRLTCSWCFWPIFVFMLCVGLSVYMFTWPYEGLSSHNPVILCDIRHHVTQESTGRSVLACICNWCYWC